MPVLDGNFFLKLIFLFVGTCLCFPIAIRLLKMIVREITTAILEAKYKFYFNLTKEKKNEPERKSPTQ